MKRTLIAAALALVSTVAFAAPVTYKIDANRLEEIRRKLAEEEQLREQDGVVRRREEELQKQAASEAAEKEAAATADSPILAKWRETGGDTGFLGAPQTAESVCPDGRGRYIHFAGGSIYWTPTTGAHSSMAPSAKSGRRSVGKPAPSSAIRSPTRPARPMESGASITSSAARSIGRRPPAPAKSTGPSATSGNVSVGKPAHSATPSPTSNRATTNAGWWRASSGASSVGRRTAVPHQSTSSCTD